MRDAAPERCCLTLIDLLESVSTLVLMYGLYSESRINSGECGGEDLAGVRLIPVYSDRNQRRPETGDSSMELETIMMGLTYET